MAPIFDYGKSINYGGYYAVDWWLQPSDNFYIQPSTKEFSPRQWNRCCPEGYSCLNRKCVLGAETAPGGACATGHFNGPYCN